MPDTAIKQIMKDYNVSEGLAKTIYKDLKKAADAGLIIDAASTLKAKLDPTTGFLTAPVNLARIGVQYYMGYELGLDDRALEKIGVYRPASEVFDDESVESYINLIVTDDHPSGFVTTDNVKELQVGTVSEINNVMKTLQGVITITDKDQIDKIKDGKIEVSVGYSNELKEEKGLFDGDAYEFKQTKIRANHLAIVDAGRCGSACKITTDHNKKEKAMIKITIDGLDFEVENEQLAQAIQKQQAMHDAEKEEIKKKSEEDEEEIEKLKKEKEGAKAEKDAAIASNLKDADLAKLVNDRATLIVDAKAILGDKMPKCTDCPMEVRTAVIDAVLPDMDLADKSDDYVIAAYDMAITKFKKAGESLKNLGDDLTILKDKDGKEITRDSARDKYMKNMGLEV